ncbi:TPA: hypothetical protein KKX52_002227 [Legionella pneumophila]|uniref:hypothetical protein n=1 Tax=Legionella longbeachae TaxID=450 RepID=UPI0009D6C27B|nr:hypothetical protein [Legionella longbeachae]HBD7398216.1 hypothetical protein [Legionella pneumophila]
MLKVNWKKLLSSKAELEQQPILHLPITYYLLPITYYLLPITYYLLPITYYLLPIAYCLLPIALELDKQWSFVRGKSNQR